MEQATDARSTGEIEVIYDAAQHCTASKASAGKAIAMDCPYTGRGVELSPTNLVEAALGGCILMAMGALAARNDIDMMGTYVDVKITMADLIPARFGQVDVTVTLPRQLDPMDRFRVERAADACPIKHSLLKDIPVSVMFEYPD